MRLPRRLGHLTYCTNIHAGETWPQVLASLERVLPRVRAALGAQRLGVGLRLSAVSAESLADPATLDAFARFLDESGCYVFTINAFPFGAFHGARVKENVYAPDWSTPARLAYTNACAGILAALLPEGVSGTVSTVPGTFKTWAPGRVDAIVGNLLEHAVHLDEIREKTGRTIILALEPEPCCLLETIDETVTFFKRHLFASATAAHLARRRGISRARASDALRRHLGVCYDVCHAAVEFEDAAASIGGLQAAGISVAKLQLSAALRIPAVTEQARALLRPYAEPVYLHQVVERSDSGLKRYLDLPEALHTAPMPSCTEWRIHFHVPIFHDGAGPLRTTQGFLGDVLDLHRASSVTEHLEVETYTFDVLPPELRQDDISTAIARELQWARDRLVR
jgi:hypothetical protein